MADARKHARCLQTGRSAADDEHSLRVWRGSQREIMFATGLGVANAVHRVTHENVADTAVLIDARADVVAAPFGQLVRQIWIGEQLATHHDEVGLAIGQHSLGLIGLHATEGDDGNVDARAHNARVLCQ